MKMFHPSSGRLDFNKISTAPKHTKEVVQNPAEKKHETNEIKKQTADAIEQANKSLK